MQSSTEFPNLCICPEVIKTLDPNAEVPWPILLKKVGLHLKATGGVIENDGHRAAIVRSFAAPSLMQRLCRLKKLDTLVSDLNSKIAAEIKAGSDAGATVNKFDVASRLGDAADKFRTQVNPEGDLAAVSESGNQFLRNQPNEISASDAQKLKQGTYRQIKSKAYGEMKSATTESQKALARGIKEELAEQFPEIIPKNAQEAKLLGLDEALEDAVNRTRNHNIFSLGAKGAAIAGGATFGGAEGAAAGTGLAIMHEVLSHPAIQSRIAIGISRASKIPFLDALQKVRTYAAAVGPTEALQADKPDDYVTVTASDGKTYHIHSDDLPEALRRDPGSVVHN